MSGVAGNVSAAPSRALFLRVAVLCATVAFLDGNDTVSVSVAGPGIIRTLGLPLSRLGPIISASLLGSMIGALTFGNLGDRFGRKQMLSLTTLIFGLFTLASAYCTSFPELMIVRLIAGLGLGGATPCFIAIVSEYVPPERRARTTSAIWTAFPVGNVVGTFFSFFLLSRYSWASIFIVGGVLPLVVFVALLVGLPSSSPLPAASRVGALGAAAGNGQVGRARFGALFADGAGASTVLLWIAFLLVWGMVAAVFFLAPALMLANGIPLKFGALALAVGGLGSLIGSPLAGFLIERFGTGPVMATTLVLSALGTATVGYDAVSVRSMTAALAFLGVFLSGMGISGMLAVAAVTYPAAVRSTGVGAAVAVGRLGQVIMPLVLTLVLAGVPAPPRYLLIAPLLLVGAVVVVLLGRRQRRMPPMAVGLAPSI